MSLRHFLFPEVWSSFEPLHVPRRQIIDGNDENSTGALVPGSFTRMQWIHRVYNWTIYLLWHTSSQHPAEFWIRTCYFPLHLMFSIFHLVVTVYMTCLQDFYGTQNVIMGFCRIIKIEISKQAVNIWKNKTSNHHKSWKKKRSNSFTT